MKNNPIISVVMATHNNSAEIEESVNAILNQTCDTFELIIINDNSSDNTLKIVNNLKKKDSRIILINNKVNLGPAKSRNLGIKRSKGKFIAINDADDISLPDRFERQLSEMKKRPSLFALGTGYFLLFKEYPLVGVKGIVGEKKNRKLLPLDNHIIHSSLFFRSNPRFLYREKFSSSQDYDLILNFLSAGFSVDNLAEELVIYRINSNGISTTKSNQQKYFRSIIQSFYYERIEHNKDSYPSFVPSPPTPVTNNKVGYSGEQFFIDQVIYYNKLIAIKLLLTSFKNLPIMYLLKKILLIFIPKRLMRSLKMRKK